MKLPAMELVMGWLSTNVLVPIRMMALFGPHSVCAHKAVAAASAVLTMEAFEILFVLALLAGVGDMIFMT